MKNKLIILFLMLIVLPSVLAVSVTYTYTTVSSDVNAVVYKISDNSKFGEFSSGINNKITINYIIDNPSAIYKTYHYKTGYLPTIYTYNLNGNIPFIIKQSNCKSSIKSVSIPSNLQPNIDFTITVNLEDITDIFKSLTIPSSIPSELTEYYKADTNVKLYIDNNLIETKTIKISTTGNAVTFTKQLPYGPHTIKITTDVTDDQCDTVNSPPIQDENVQTITINPPATYQCSDGIDNDNDGKTDYPSDPGCSSTTDNDEYNAPTTNPCTSSDWLCTQWSSCTNSQQTKTCTKTKTCDGETGKPAESKSCTQCSDTYDNDNDNKIDYPSDPGCSSLTDNDETDLEPCPQTGQTCPNNAYTKCPTGHPKCSCTGDLKAYLCTPDQDCKATSLEHQDPGLGICCSQPCIKKSEPCTEEGKLDLLTCLPTEAGCVMQRRCKNGLWKECEKLNLDCIKGSPCIDGTPSGYCSNQTDGKLCSEGTLTNNDACLKIPCKEEWYCKDFTEECINNNKYCISDYIDLNKCNTTIVKPLLKQPCGYNNPITEEEFLARLGTAEGELSTTSAEEKSKEQQPSIQSTIDQILGIPSTFRIKIGFETPFIMLIIAIFLIAITTYYFKRPKPIKKLTKETPQKKEETHKIKVNDLLLSVIESLQGDERKIVDKLVEKEGIRINELGELLGINKTKMEIALQKLEKRQIIKERTGDNSKLFFNDWLK